jgi:hypothetical protein
MKVGRAKTHLFIGLLSQMFLSQLPSVASSIHFITRNYLVMFFKMDQDGLDILCIEFKPPHTPILINVLLCAVQ